MKFFKTEEFECPRHCGQCLGKMNARLLEMLDEARGLAGVPFVVNSGYRCPERNKTVGGVPDSAHLKGMAVDIACTGSKVRYLIVQSLLAAGVQRIECAPTWIHADVDEDKPSPAIFYQVGGKY